MTDSLLIAIDGPSGSGKSSTSRGVAQRLGLAYLDTGSLYRAAAICFLESGLDVAQTEQIAALVTSAAITPGTDPLHPSTMLDGRDVTAEIREPRVSEKVSVVATNLAVREWLNEQFRTIIAAADRRIVVEGRDITTVVAPDADLRVLLVADPAARIARRQAELGGSVNADQVTDQVVRRDRDDATVSQFEEPAEGVELVDSTHMGLDEVIETICGMVPGHA
ncbi:cytidylate kinase [Luteococcus japonicus]|uniref:Cytidylate kinase n=2 Tax=Luteococcus japonicus TaxID=33984 RepID=A0A1R4IQ42_9ACTN|nr:(d)CMP kinase [Luteococcus japonicus]ROR53488.1 cytidylate kinase [Luteococcus japonicus]SJN22011.1 Cytidylate kinase [Luteococcus japonicus LSP_Lj1]